nr:siderophore-interacting protein [Streptacidiphilus albus]
MTLEAPVPVAGNFRLFAVHVARTELLTPGMLRVTLAGEALDGFVNGGCDQRIKLLLPLPGQEEPVLPESGVDDGGWYAAWQRLPDRWRPVMRTYTLRAQRREAREIDVDVALHLAPGGGALREGPASRWARGARPGDRIGVVGPAVPNAGGVEFRLPDGAGHLLLAGDETALPAVGCILESLPAGLPVQVHLRVADPADRQSLPTAADATVHWLHRGGPELVESVAAAALPAGRGYAWIAGEAAQVRALRRHLVGERGMAREDVEFMGYWRRGRSESDPAAESEEVGPGQRVGA